MRNFKIAQNFDLIQNSKVKLLNKHFILIPKSSCYFSDYIDRFSFSQGHRFKLIKDS